jgi:hypothetical protein
MKNYQFMNLDAGESVFFNRQLDYLKRGSYDIRFPNFRAFELLPVSTDAGPSAEYIRYQTYEPVGMAKIVPSYADDLPRVDLKASEEISRIYTIACSYGYSIQEIRYAQMAGIPLERRKANAARQAHDYLANRLAWFGDADFNITGFLNNPNVPVATAPADGTGGSTRFRDKTADQVIRDLNNLINSIISATNGVERPNTLIMSLDAYSYISTTARSANSDTTILDFFLENNPYIDKVEGIWDLKEAGAGGSDVAIAYDNNPDKLTLEIPSPFEALNPQDNNLEFKVPTISRFGGVIFYYPLSAAVLEGI